MSQQQDAQDFLDLLIAAMKDAAGEKKITQIQTSLENPYKKGKMEVIRIIVVPEEMEYKSSGTGEFGVGKSTGKKG